MYAEAPVSSRLRCAWPMPSQWAADGIDGASLTVTGGALDGIERVLAAWLTPADRVIVEDPGHAVTFDLLAAMSLTAVPVPVDGLGVRPAALAAALDRGAGALIVTPRAQAATGVAWDAPTCTEIGEVLRRHPWRRGHRGRSRRAGGRSTAFSGLRGLGPLGHPALGIQVAWA